MELGSLVDVRQASDVLYLLTGHGFGGFQVFDSDMNALGLNLADYSASELEGGYFLSPHLFLSYWLLKVGVVGIVLYSLAYACPLASTNIYFRNVYAASVLVLLWQGYWTPSFALLTGIFFGLRFHSEVSSG